MKTKERRHTKDIHQQSFFYVVVIGGTFGICEEPMNAIGSAGATSLSEALKSNTTITELDLSGECKREKIQRTSISKSLFSFLFTSTDNKIGERGAKSLSEALKSNTTLTELDLWGEDKRRHTNDIHQQFTPYHFFSYQQTTRLEKEEQHH